MNAAWAKEWAVNFANPDKLIDMYTDDAQFEDVIIAHKESGKAAIKKFFQGLQKQHDHNLVKS